MGLAIGHPLRLADGRSAGLTAGSVGGPIIAGVMFTVIGVAVGVLCRGQAASALVICGWFVVEKLLAMFLGGATCLPYGLLDSLLGLGGAATSRGAAAVALAGYAVIVTLAAGLVLARRDVT